MALFQFKVQGISKKGEFYYLSALCTKKSGMKFSAGQVAKVRPTKKSKDFAVLYFYSAPDEKGVKFVFDEDGAVKQKLALLKKGATFYAEGPFGNFKLKKKSGTAIFFAKRLGVAPVRSMVSCLLSEKTKPTIYMFCEASTRAEIPDEDELRALAKDKNVNLRFALLAENPLVWDGKLSELSAQDLKGLRGAKSANYYVVGPITFVNRILVMLGEMRIPQKNISSEQWG